MHWAQKGDLGSAPWTHDKGPSVIKIRNFQGFLNPGNHQKPAKTGVVEYSETYVPFSGNLARKKQHGNLVT
jgi:hypothetical protein